MFFFFKIVDEYYNICILKYRRCYLVDHLLRLGRLSHRSLAVILYFAHCSIAAKKSYLLRLSSSKQQFKSSMRCCFSSPVSICDTNFEQRLRMSKYSCKIEYKDNFLLAISGKFSSLSFTDG